MQYVRRFLEARLQASMGSYGAVVVTGPRQAGKSTLLQHMLGLEGQPLSSVAFDTPSEVDAFRSDPDLFFAEHSTPLLLDEVQRVPDIFSYVKREVDRTPGTFRFFLSGSQSFELMRGVSESLAGRADILDLWPMAVCEPHSTLQEARRMLETITNPAGIDSDVKGVYPCSSSEDVCPAMMRGGYPRVALGQVGLEWLVSYRRTYIERDIRGLAAVHDVGRFDRFLRLVAGRTAQVFNKAELSRLVQVDNKTIDHWLDVLEQGYQVLRLPPWFGNVEKRLVKRPKFHIADSGLGLSLQAIRTPESLVQAPHFGHLFESFVVMEIRKLFGHVGEIPNLYFWAQPGSHECDLVIEQAGRLTPIEIKHARRLRPDDWAGVKAFMELYGDAAPAGVILSLDPQLRKVHDRIWNVPLGLLLAKPRV